ncbi:hypothetical protein J4211_01055 [Candidatus Woesearchaeota archaeon]|nr:hypothetical protein [Candidatus Woesearchaeota archaeon]
MRFTALFFLALLCIACTPPSKTQELAQQLVSERSEPSSVHSLIDTHPDNTINETKLVVSPQPLPGPPVEQIPNISLPLIIPAVEPTSVVQPVPEENVSENESFSTIAVDVTQTPKRAPLYYFLDLFAKKVNSYQFTYNGNYYALKGTKYRVVLSHPGTAREVTFSNTTRRQFYFDTVYVDRVAKTATGYCEGRTSNVNHQCATLELYDLAYSLPFNDYLIVLPEDWLLSYLNRDPSSFEENKYYVSDHSTILFTFNETNSITELNFDQSTGLVIRADQKVDTVLVNRYDYKDLAANKVRDGDVIHRSKSEIPSEETFER